jgi:hypothetical protein
MSGSSDGRRAGQNTELRKAAREALARAALAAVALVVAVLIPVPMWAKILIFFTILFVAGIAMRVGKVRGPK